MDERFYCVSHQNTSVLVNDYTGLEGKALVDQIVANRRAILEMNEDNLRVLVKTKSYINIGPIAMDEFKESSRLLKHLFLKTAVVGTSGLQSVLINTINILFGLEVRAFDSHEDAVDWLSR